MAASISHPKVGALIDWQVADGMAVNVRRRLALCVHACRYDLNSITTCIAR